MNPARRNVENPHRLRGFSPNVPPRLQSVEDPTHRCGLSTSVLEARDRQRWRRRRLAFAALAALAVALAVYASGVFRSAPAPAPSAIQGPPGTMARAPGQVLSRSPYMGVACHGANSIACDRVGLAIWLKRPAHSVRATIDGRPLSLARFGNPLTPGTEWAGYLKSAGIVSRLHVRPVVGTSTWLGAGNAVWDGVDPDRLRRRPARGHPSARAADGGMGMSEKQILEIDPSSPVALHEQVAAAIRRAIADGEAGSGDRLPPARDLAAVLGVNANTVLRGLRTLRDEGLLELRRGRGVTVAGAAPRRSLVVAKARELVTLGRELGYRPAELSEILDEVS